MGWETRLVEQIQWTPIHGAATRIDKDGNLVFRDGAAFDWHVLRWTDPRLDGARVKLSIVAKPADTCDTNLYVNHWGDIDVCSIDKEGNTVLNEGNAQIQADRLTDGYLHLSIVFENRHQTLSIGTGKPRGRYHGSGLDQYNFKSVQVELLPLNKTRKMIVDRLWKGIDPFRGLPSNLFNHDLQGWNSQHPYLSETIAKLRPAVIVEIGVWKGGSTVFMANELKKRALSSLVIAVDTYLGSGEHWIGPFERDLPILNGFPALYYTFVSNIIHAGVVDYVLPLPMDSLNAAQIVRALHVTPEMIHLDGGHDYESVMADLRAWWPLLARGGILIGDDYFLDGTWSTVKKAFDEFFHSVELRIESSTSGKCLVRKPN